MVPTQPQAGWYDDPDGRGGERYWDGQRWTTQRRPTAQGQASVVPEIMSPKPAYAVPNADWRPDALLAPSPNDYLVSPGWFPDPEGSTSMRWWDGRAWTEDRKPGIARACLQCGAGALLAPNQSDHFCSCCRGRTSWRRCVWCGEGMVAPPWLTSAGIRRWKCGRCGNEAKWEQWRPLPVSGYHPMDWEISFYRERLDEALSNPDRRFIDGSIVSVSGLSGIASGAGAIVFDSDCTTLMLGDFSRPVRLSYEDITGLQAGGRGEFTTTTGGGWVGGGFGSTMRGTVEGMVKGYAIAAVMNALTTKTQRHVETIIQLTWTSGSLTIFNDQLSPAEWARLLKPVFKRINDGQREVRQQTVEKTCPFCAETIKAAAIKCRYCGSALG